jgi:MFS transporter, DHA1 family, tetracycline resistance protein
MTTKPSTSRALFALMLVLFIDGMGQGLFFPVLNATLIDPHTHILLVHESLHVRLIWYGVLVSVYYLMWFLSATLLGDWSDNVGRKKALLICLILAAIGFILSAISFQVISIWLLLFSRFIGGITSGDQAIAQASVIDLCDPKKKPIYLGLVLLSVTMGLVIGPLIGGILENPAIVSWFNEKTPFYFATILASINVLLLWFFYQETHITAKPHKIQWTRVLHVFIESFRFKVLRTLLFAFLFGQLGWSMIYVFAGDFLATQYHFTPTQTGIFFALMGAGLGIGLGVLPSLIKSKAHKLIAAVGYGIMIIPSLFFIFSKSPLPLWIVIVPTTALLGLGYAHILPLFSEAVVESRQGWIMGVTGSMVALTAGVDSLVSGFLTKMNIHLPFVFTAVSIILGVIFLICYHASDKKVG